MNKSNKISIKDVDFESLFKSFFSPLVGFAYKIVGNYDVSKDLVQEMFIKIWNKGIIFESQKSIKVYLYLSTRNICLDYIKSEKRKGHIKDIDEILETENALFFQSDDVYVTSIIREESSRLLYSALDKLSENPKKVMKLTLEGKSIKDIAKEMNLSVNTIKSHKLLSYRKLKEILGESKSSLIFVVIKIKKEL